MIQYQGLETLEVLTDAKNYNKWIASEIKPHIKSPALEIGAGTGNLTQQFLHTKSLYITDCDKGLVRHLKERFAQEKNVTSGVLDITKRIPKALRSHFSTVYAINVLEHIKDDMLALEKIHALLKKNGRLVLLVPAKQFAYTKLDGKLGHFRRYEKEELIKKLITNGYRIESIRFFNIIGLLSWYIRDKVARGNINLKPYHIKIFDSIVPILKMLESLIQIPVGISLIVVARKI